MKNKLLFPFLDLDGYMCYNQFGIFTVVPIIYHQPEVITDKPFFTSYNYLNRLKDLIVTLSIASNSLLIFFLIEKLDRISILKIGLKFIKP